MAETPSNGGLSCIFVECDNFNSSCSYTCLPSVEPLPLFPAPPPPPPSSQTHIAPYLIAIVCVLGISFLFLTTCTIILRYRFARSRQGVTPSNSDDSGNNDDHTFVDHPVWHITTVGLQQSVIDSITAFKYKKIDGFFPDGSDSSCSVCLTEFQDGDDLRLLPKCSHAFHVSCIDTWLRSHKNCPLCRAPIVNEIFGCNPVVGSLNSSNSTFGVESRRVGLDDNNGGEGSSHQFRERGNDLGRLPILEGIKIADILKRNRELRIFSDLGENHRFRGVDDDGLHSVTRSISFNSVAITAKCGAMMSNEGCSKDGSFNEGGSSDGSFNEGCSRNGNSEGVLQQKKTDLMKGGNKRGSSMSGLLIKSSSIGRSLQKGPVSMKRSLSSSSRFFSFRRSKSQASILPL